MVNAVDRATPEEAEVIRDLGEMRPVVRHVGPALAGLDELERALDVVTLTALHGRLLLTFAHERLKVEFLKLGLGVEGIDVGRPAFHHEENHVFSLSTREVGLAIG